MSATTVQMSIQIDADLKARGDEALARAGYTPSQAVHALWKFAAAHASEPEKIRHVLSFHAPLRP